MLFYRYQDNPEMDYSSVHVGLEQMYWELQEDAMSVEEIYINNEHILKVRSDNPKELYQKLLNCKTPQELAELSKKYPLRGICGYYKSHLDSMYSLEELINSSDVDFSEYRKYLAIYEGELLADDDCCGAIFKPIRIVELIERKDLG